MLGLVCTVTISLSISLSSPTVQFGFRNIKVVCDCDPFFRAAVEAFQKKGTLTKFLPAFSRDAPDNHSTPKYVQDNIRSHSSEIHCLIHDQEAVVFVCGDAKNMAKDVSAAIEDVVVREQGR